MLDSPDIPARRLKDRVALVIGAGSSAEGWSNGKAAALSYAREGARVVAADVSEQNLRGTVEAITAEGRECVLCVADAAVSGDVQRMVALAIQTYGRIDILHYNVGIARLAELVDITESDWNDVLRINLTGAFFACKFALPIMVRQRHGVFTAISSIAAVRVLPYPAVSYNVSKAGLEQLVRTVAVQYAPHGVRANIVQPGMLDTPVNRSHVGDAGFFASEEERYRERSARVPMGFMGDAWDVARAAVFLASDEARYINGVTLPVDGALRSSLR